MGRRTDYKVACWPSWPDPGNSVYMPPAPQSSSLLRDGFFPLPEGGLALDPSTYQEVLLALCTHLFSEDWLNSPLCFKHLVSLRA